MFNIIDDDSFDVKVFKCLSEYYVSILLILLGCIMTI